MNFSPLTDLNWWTVIAAGICVFAIYSFLYRENPFYRFFEHLFIGISTAILVMEPIRTFLWPQTLKPLLGYDRIPFPDGTYPEAYNLNYLLFIIPICFGLLYYFILSPKHNWLAQVVIGFSLGIGGGLAFKGVLAELLPQLTDSFRPLYSPQLSSGENINNLVFLFVLFSVLSYFFFTFRRKPGGLVEKSSYLGRWMMMGCFGAFFGATIMARMALLVERLEFMINDWWPALKLLWQA